MTKSITITLEEPYELLIYCSRYGCDWRLRDPVTKRFGKAPQDVYFICHKRKSFETRKGNKKDRLEMEMQGVCGITREWIRDQEDIETIRKALEMLEERCDMCDIVSRCIGEAPLEYVIEEAIPESVSTSFSLFPATCYLHVEERYGSYFYEREYEGRVVDCFD